MKDILSQAEIDTLLSALTAGELEAEQAPLETEARVKPYDFRRPNKFSKEQLRTLGFIHENFCHLVSNFLSGYLRSNIQVKVLSVEQITYEDFALSIPIPTLLTMVNLSPLPGTVVLETNLSFIFPVIDLLFGGVGLGMAKTRELTEIELSVIRTLNERLLENLRHAWHDIADFDVKILSLETNPQLVPIMSPNEVVVVITFQTRVGKHDGLINLCLPYVTLEPVLPKLSARHWFGTVGGAFGESFQQQLTRLLAGVSVGVEVLVGSADVTVGDILNLRPGDVIVLESRVDGELTAYVEGCPRFEVRPGTVGDKIAVQIVRYKGGDLA